MNGSWEPSRSCRQSNPTSISTVDQQIHTPIDYQIPNLPNFRILYVCWPHVHTAEQVTRRRQLASSARIRIGRTDRKCMTFPGSTSSPVWPPVPGNSKSVLPDSVIQLEYSNGSAPASIV